MLTRFADQGPNSRTKGSRLRSLFFELQEKYFSLELANLILSEETKTLSSGKISVRGLLIQVRYSRLLSSSYGFLFYHTETVRIVVSLNALL